MLNEFRSTNITWDKATSRIYSPVTANASDENGRKLVVQIVNGGKVEDLTGATLHLYWGTIDKAHDGLDVFKAVDLKKGEFELSYTTGMLSNKGVLNANLVLVDTIGRVVSERFKITVKEGIDNDAIQSENSFTTLTQALIDISNLETNYAPRLNDLTAQLQQTEQEFNARLAQKAQQVEQLGRSKADKSDIDDFNNRIDKIITTPTDLISEQEIVDARQGKLSLGENLMALKDNLKTILEPTGKDNKEYVLNSGRFGADGLYYRDVGFVRYNEYFGGHGVNGVVRNTNTTDYIFDVVYYDQAQNFIKRDRYVTNSKYVVDEKYLFRVAISRVDSAAIIESDKAKIYNAIHIADKINIEGNISGNISGDIILGKDSVKLENMADRPRIIYPYPISSLVIEKVKGVAVYFYASNIMVRNHSGNINFNRQTMKNLLPDYVSDSPSGGTDYIRIPEKKSLVYDVPEKTLKVVEWQQIKTTQDLLLLSNHDDLMGVLADYWKWSILEDTSNKVKSLTQDDPSVNIPDYWNSHINEKINQIRSNQLPLGKDGFSFGFITDIHYNPRNTGYEVSSPHIMSKVMKDCSIKFFVNGGDMGNQQNGENGREVVISDYYGLMGKFKDAGIIDKMLPLIGNHESNTQNWKIGDGDFNNVMVNNDEVYSILFRDTERIHSISYGGDGTYYYVDDIPNQVRYVCLNTNDVEYTEVSKIDYAVKQQQFDWLINEALELPNADWSVVLATHIPPVTQDFYHRGMPVRNMELLKGVVKAFKNKSTFSNSESHSDSSYNANVSVDFTGNENDFIVWIAGHHHRDHVTLVDGSYTVVLTADDGRRTYDNPVKIIGTDTEHVMDFFTVDKTNKRVLITRVGAGEDREFTY